MRLWLCVLLIVTSPLLAQVKMLVFAGSARQGSYNKELATVAATVGKEMGFQVTQIDLKDFPMPFFDEDLEAKGEPKNVKRFRALISANEVITVASPEYNGSVSALLKNAIDWASRDPNVLSGKQFALMSASPGKGGGAKGLIHLRSILEDCGGTVLEREVSVPRAFEGFGKEKVGLLKEEIRGEFSEIKPRRE
jgi:chromate reductase